MTILDVDWDTVLIRTNADPEFTRRARDWSTAIVFDDGVDQAVHAIIGQGRVRAIERVPSGTTAAVVFTGPAAGWEELLRARPAAHYQDVWLGATKVDFTATIVDELEFTAYYGAFQRLWSIAREVNSGQDIEVACPDDAFRDTDTAIGRYVHCVIGGVRYRIYHEQAGDPDGVPLLLLHTAGADSRQWRHVLADPALQPHHRIVSIDLPFHGRSLPPTDGTPWWRQSYRPDREWLLDAVVEISDALDLHRPIVMGCSVGGQLVTDLLAERADRFRGGVALNAYLHQDHLAMTAWSRTTATA